MRSVKLFCLLLFSLGGGGSAALGQLRPLLDVPYVQSRTKVVDGLLKLAGVKKGDVLYDLGCGDGRIVVTAAKDFGATGVGVDLDPQRIAEANANANAAGVADQAKFVTADLFDVDLSKATVITIYLLPTVNMQLRPKLLALKPGTRIVSHAFGMGDWKPDKTEEVDGSTIYLWIVPKKNML
jgi:trans-aconitate methyltransferase